MLGSRERPGLSSIDASWKPHMLVSLRLCTVSSLESEHVNPANMKQRGKQKQKKKKRRLLKLLKWSELEETKPTQRCWQVRHSLDQDMPKDQAKRT